jgi:cation:H+ antiporter
MSIKFIKTHIKKYDKYGLMEFLTQSDIVIFALATMIFGMAILVKGGDLTIDGAVVLARHYGMPPLLVGFTIVAFGTSLPELIASLNANMNGMPSIAVGGMIGSNISNILLVGGVCAFITPLVIKASELRNDFIMLSLVTVVWSFMLMTMPITPIVGIVAIGLLLAYVVLQYKLATTGQNNAKALIEAEEEIESHAPSNHKPAVIMVLCGLVGLAIGAELLIRGAVTTARIIGIRESVIGLTIVALGTSLPELTTCALAAMKKQGDMIIGNIIGSNIFNLMMVLGGITFVAKYDITTTEPTVINQDIPIMIGVTALFIMILLAFKKLPRWAGAMFAVGYVTYIGMLAYQSMG